MSRIRSSGTTIEKLFGLALKRGGLKYRKQHKIFGKPDYALVDKRTAIFCDSAFWHGYKLLKTKRHAFKTNKAFWIKKILQNIKRDKLVNRNLKKDGWTVLRFWDFEIKKDSDSCVTKLQNILNGKVNEKKLHGC